LNFIIYQIKKNIFCFKKKALEKHIENPVHDKSKTDVFLIGMCILEAYSLHKCDNCYDYYHGWIFEDKINLKLDIIKNALHDSLFYILKDMLMLNE
jgi:hypothetical protein